MCSVPFKIDTVIKENAMHTHTQNTHRLQSDHLHKPPVRYRRCRWEDNTSHSTGPVSQWNLFKANLGHAKLRPQKKK